ncbi:MAG: phenylalanine--tRNA ligase subunit beta [Acidobacteriota bacterium]
MNISYNWLQEFVDLKELGVGAPVVADALTSIGLAVEGLEFRDSDGIFNIDVTSNRPDCLNHLGVARELAAHFRLKLHTPDLSDLAPQQPANAHPSSVSIEDPELCPQYTARIMAGVQVDESPAWLKEKLEAVGQRPINNIVDITNYVLLLLGHPLHAFDYEKLAGRRIVVRTARPGETIVTLDGVNRVLQPGMLAICDASKPVALAGVMGGQESEISLQTTTILLESAYFNPKSIRATSKALGLRTEASYRFERGADPEMPLKALNLACRLIQQIASGQTVGPAINQNPVTCPRTVLELRRQRIRQVVGVEIDPEFVAEILERLQFDVEKGKGDGWRVTVPGFRVDVGQEDDLVEEVARHHGYDDLPSTYPKPASAGRFLPSRRLEQLLLERLRGFGFYEAINYVFSTPEQEKLFFGESTPMVPIANPLTEEDTHLRTSLVPGLVSSVRRNLNHGTREIRLFELGHVFSTSAHGEIGPTGEPLLEQQRLGIVATGTFYRPYWGQAADELRFYHLKGIIEELLRGLGYQAVFRRTETSPFLHPGVAAEVVVDGNAIGIAGQLSPELHESFKFLQRVYVAELALDGLFSRPVPEPQYGPLPRFPSTERDLSFVVDKGIEYDRIAAAIKSLNVANLRDVQLIDLYQGQKLPSGKVSLAVRLTFADLTRTLTQDEVNKSVDLVSGLLKREFHAEQRS